ncbi:MAG: hypothetical protein N2442_14900 [Spirochaetes bacterium]|nr:hypothetical protein [Spirochaetota bacterium]
MSMTEEWVRYLGLGSLFLGASIHRLFLCCLSRKVVGETRLRRLSVFLGLLTFAFLWFLVGIWSSFQESFVWSMEHADEFGFLVSLGTGGGILLSGAASLSGIRKILGVALVCFILFFPFFFFPRLFKEWSPVWDSEELCSLEIIRLDREGTGLIITLPRKGALYVSVPERTITLQIRERSLSLVYRMFALPPLYCKIVAVGSFLLESTSNEGNKNHPFIRALPQQKERMVLLTLEARSVFTSFSIRCDANGKYRIEEG